jgi:hypothetical protein
MGIVTFYNAKPFMIRVFIDCHEFCSFQENLEIAAAER